MGGDHPRSRGVYGRGTSVIRSADGSSPLARGLRHPGDADSGEDRIIPARAGSTLSLLLLIPIKRDHPRSRGVYAALYCREMKLMGSSPLARGLPVDGGGNFSRVRIIPARAGSTTCRTSHPRALWDHPRSRGVYHTSSWTVISVVGSSPLARGLLMDIVIKVC